MRFFTVSILSALAAAVSAATTPDYTKGPSGNPIALPGLNDQVPVGQPYQIKWQPTTPGDVSIWLLRGPSNNVKPIATIANNIPNNGEFTWTPSTSLENDVTHYGLIIIVEGTGQYQYSTQFGIKNTAAAGAADTTSSAAAVEPTSTAEHTTAPVTTSSSSAVAAEPTTSASSSLSIETTESSVVKTAVKSTATSSAPAEASQTTAATPVVPPSNSAASSSSAVAQTSGASTPTTFASSTVSTPTQSQTSPSASFTGGADRKTAGFGAVAVAAGLMAVYAF